MKTINILIVAESEEDRGVIDSQISKLPFLCNSKFAESLGEAIAKIVNSLPDIVIVDTNTLSFESINMLCTAIPGSSLSVIVVSDKVIDAVESYNSGIPVDFILKPVLQERLQLAITRAIRNHLSLSLYWEQNYLFLKIGRVYKKFLFDDIIYVEGYGIYSKIMTPKGKLTINDSIMSLEGKLSENKFIRVHKSFIINTAKVVAFKTNVLEMEIGEIPIGANYKDRLEGFLQMFKK